MGVGWGVVGGDWGEVMEVVGGGGGRGEGFAVAGGGWVARGGRWVEGGGGGGVKDGKG